MLSALAAAGVGPILPLKLLCAASARLGGPDRPFRVRDVLADLRGMVVRDRAGTDDEHVGLFHETFADYLLVAASESYRIDSVESHRAIVEAIEELLPSETQSIQDPLQHYAVIKEADHYWALGDYRRVELSLLRRKPANEVERVLRYNIWQKWIQSIAVSRVSTHMIKRIVRALT